MRLVASVFAGAALTLLLAGCVPGAPAAPEDTGDPAPIGPVPAPGGPLTLDRVTAIAGLDDAGPTMLFTAGDAVSTSGDDLASERDYWIAVEGTPDTCADVVSAPYLVSSHDAGSRLDDPSALVGTFTEVDESRFGLIQVYAREFDDETTAAGFLSEFTEAVSGCPGYELTDYSASGLEVGPRDGVPSGVAGLDYRESAGEQHGVTVTFLQRESVVVSVYAEVFPNSTITTADADALADRVAERLAFI